MYTNKSKLSKIWTIDIKYLVVFFYTKIHILDILRSVYSEAIVAMVAAPADSVVVAVIQLRSNFIFVQNCKILLISSFIPLISRV